MDRAIFHVDMDAFYAACEISRNPELKGKPVIIGADPKEGVGRGVVMTCSYEARKYGVRSGMPISQAFKICPNGTYLRPDMKFYMSISSRVMDVLRSYADVEDNSFEREEEKVSEPECKFEQWGLDEAFIDVTKGVLGYANPIDLARKIKEDIFNLLNLTCSIGIGPNKQVAKIASAYQKPDGITYIPPEKVREFLDPLPVDKIMGIGPKTKSALEELGIKTIEELADYSTGDLNERFGKMGVYLSNIARGVDNSPVRSKHERKSIGSEITFERDIQDFEIIYKTLNLLADKLYKDLLSKKLQYRTIEIKIRFEGFATYIRQQKLPVPLKDKRVALEVGKKLLKEFEFDKRKVRLLGFRFKDLFKNSFVQKTLFDF